MELLFYERSLVGHRGNTSTEETIRKFFSNRSGQEDVRANLPEIYPRLWRFALVLTGDGAAAEDLAQATAERALLNASKFTAGTSLDRWLFTIARRIWLNEKRAETVRRAGGLISVDDIDIPAQNLSAEMNILAREVFDQVMGLPEAQRETVMLTYVEGYTYRETAEILDIPIGTVMSRLAAARKRIAGEKTGRRREAK